MFGRHNIKRLRSMGLFRNGIPSEPTLSRVLSSVDGEAMATQMTKFADRFRKEALQGTDAEIICIDGKATRGTVHENGRTPDIVSAYSPGTGLTLATDMCDCKSNEIKSVPRLLDKIEIAGCIVTADAMSFQKDIIDKIRRLGADFIIELKANRRTLRYGIEDKIKQIEPEQVYTEGTTLTHGRITSRTCRIYRGEELIVDKEKWRGKLTVVEVLTGTTVKSTGKHVSEQRLYVSGLDCDAKKTQRNDPTALVNRKFALGA